MRFSEIADIMEISVRMARQAEDWAAIREIREQVFVVEQKVDREEEYDLYEETSTHYLAFSKEGNELQPIGTCRWRETLNGVKMERFAVLATYRAYGVGSALVKIALGDILKKPRLGEIYLHAQIQAVNFYKKHGFQTIGEAFWEANIEHRKMILPND